MRHVLRAAALVFGVCNGYHALNVAARLAGVHALRGTMQFDPAVLEAYMAQLDDTHGH
jgi:hypothetical protein